MAPYRWGKTAVKGCAGHLVNNTVARVVKPDGTLGKYGETGELHVRRAVGGHAMAISHRIAGPRPSDGFGVL